MVIVGAALSISSLIALGASSGGKKCVWKSIIVIESQPLFLPRVFQQARDLLQAVAFLRGFACGSVFGLYAFVYLFAVYGDVLWRFYAEFYLPVVDIYDFDCDIVADADSFLFFACEY